LWCFFKVLQYFTGYIFVIRYRIIC
jgi:hypothetical protein